MEKRITIVPYDEDLYIPGEASNLRWGDKSAEIGWLNEGRRSPEGSGPDGCAGPGHGTMNLSTEGLGSL